MPEVQNQIKQVASTHQFQASFDFDTAGAPDMQPQSDCQQDMQSSDCSDVRIIEGYRNE